MESFCECGNHYKGFNDVFDYLMKNYGKFSKTKSNEIKSRKRYDNLEKQYTTLKETIKSIPEKANVCIFIMNNCGNNHKDEIKDIKTKIENSKTLLERIEYYHQKLITNIPDELDEYSDEEEENNIIKKEDENNDDLIYENIDVRKTMENDLENIKLIETLIDKAEIDALKEEERKKIIKLKNQLIELWNYIEVELNHQGEQIDYVEDKVDEGLNQIVEGNDQQLEKAAKSAIKRRRLAYQGGLALTLGAIGTIVPGIGNAIGIALGGIIGYGLYKIDKHRLNKVLKEKKRIREERNNEK